MIPKDGTELEDPKPQLLMDIIQRIEFCLAVLSWFDATDCFPQKNHEPAERVTYGEAIEGLEQAALDLNILALTSPIGLNTPFVLNSQEYLDNNASNMRRYRSFGEREALLHVHETALEAYEVMVVTESLLVESKLFEQLSIEERKRLELLKPLIADN